MTEGGSLLKESLRKHVRQMKLILTSVPKVYEYIPWPANDYPRSAAFFVYKVYCDRAMLIIYVLSLAAFMLNDRDEQLHREPMVYKPNTYKGYCLLVVYNCGNSCV